MQKLHSYVFKKILRSAIVPIVLAEVLLIIVILLASYYRFEGNKELVLERSTQGFESLTSELAKRMEQEFSNVMNDATALKRIIEPAFDTMDIGSTSMLNFGSSQGFYFVKESNIASIYTTNISQLTEIDKKNLQMLYLMVLPVDAILEKHGKKIDAAWINIGSKYSLFYPKINLYEEVSPDLDATQQSYYFRSGEKFNPERKTIFIPLFNESWALSIGQIGAVVSPIYKDNKMIGVVGISLTSQSAKKLSEIALPLNAYVMITDEEGYLLFSSNEEESVKDFSIASFTGLYKDGKNEALKKFTYSPSKNSNYLFHEHMLGDSHLKLILVTKKSEIEKDFVDILIKTRNVGLAILVLIVLLHLYLYRKLKISTEQMTSEITGPISDVSSASNRLFYEEAFRFEKSDIKELNVLHTNLEKAHYKLINQLYFDATTSLSNQKKLLLDIKENESLILVKINNLKDINSSYGTEIGEAVLKDFVFKLQGMYKNYFEIYRVDSDIFALLGVNKKELSNYYNEVQDIIIVKDNISIVLNFSLAMAEPSKTSELTLFTRAEIALDEAEKQEHLKYVVFDENKHLKDYQNNVKWAQKLQEAFDEERLVAYFQPIYNIKENCVYKFESLVRMIESDKVISPSFFLGAAARMGKLSNITRIMLKQVFETSVNFPQIEFSINVSFEDFEQADLLPEIKNLMKRYKVNASNIIFELLETGTLGDEEKIIETIQELKSLGCKIAIDDFGTGNSNFAHLMLLNVDYIKIDGQFIKNIDEDQQSLNITTTVKAFADMTRSQTIAEFVTNKEIFDVVKELGIDFAQGNFISEPKPASQIGKMLKIGKTSSL